VIDESAVWFHVELSTSIDHDCIGTVFIGCDGVGCSVDDTISVGCCRFQPPTADTGQSHNGLGRLLRRSLRTRQPRSQVNRICRTEVDPEHQQTMQTLTP